jgi:hypothetical protein
MKGRKRWIQGGDDGIKGRISCDPKSPVTYCVTSDWLIAKCGDLSCFKRRSIIPACTGCLRINVVHIIDRILL